MKYTIAIICLIPILLFIVITSAIALIIRYCLERSPRRRAPLRASFFMSGNPPTELASPLGETPRSEWLAHRKINDQLKKFALFPNHDCVYFNWNEYLYCAVNPDGCDGCKHYQCKATGSKLEK